MSRVEILPPGFLNLFINWEEWVQRDFELPKYTNEKVVIEHTSINPNKSAHIGHLRNSCIGDTLVRLLRRVGYHVEVHNYIDDLGNQLADTVVGLLNIPLSGEYERFGDYCWDLYATTNKEYQTVEKAPI
ncbi:arginine--tRNA ligase [Paenibacillus lentus]|uniref:arginine--tRNA ligase domain-containing protein n=1 Tax=Paenibacillus lentus TaxID=1338368 RepID=UPI002696AFB7